MYKTLEVLGPEHEYAIVNERLEALPIVDKIIKTLRGHIDNTAKLPMFTLGKELQLHVIELKPNKPFKSPVEFEETIQEAVLYTSGILEQKYGGNLLGTGMHPLLTLEETEIWPHRDKQIYDALGKIFTLKQHGWLNIQSFQLNLPYSNERDGIMLHTFLANLSAYLPAITAASPFVEGNLGKDADNRLTFYMNNQREIPSITRDVVPEYVNSFKQYRKEIIGKYSQDLAMAGADQAIIGKEWINSRGVIFRFDRQALEIRVMDEQECVKSDVALSCFIRSLMRGWFSSAAVLMSHETLVADLKAIIKDGFDAKTRNPCGHVAKGVCECLLKVAENNASKEEKRYLSLIRKRIEQGNLSSIIRERVTTRSQKTDLEEAITDVYSNLTRNLIDNEPYF
jgi:carboxylate-amine ligase